MKRITVLGAGTMGHGIAQVYAQHGFEVMLYDIKNDILVAARGRIENSLALATAHGLIEAHRGQSTLANIQYTTDLDEALHHGEFITEAVPEVLELKWSLFDKIESTVPVDTIVASNTSSLSLTQLVSRVSHPERFIITHYFNPAQLVPLVEVVGTESTHLKTIQTTIQLLKMCQKTPVQLTRDIPGFIANRLQAAVVRESLHLVREGVASPAEIDMALKAGPGFRWAFLGALETADFGGLDIWQHVTENLFPELAQDTAPPEWLMNLVQQGHLGVKTGKGIFTYTESDIPKLIQKRDEQFAELAKIRVK